MSISEHCESFDGNNMDTVNGLAQRNGDPEKDFDNNDVDRDYYDQDFTNNETKMFAVWAHRLLMMMVTMMTTMIIIIMIIDYHNIDKDVSRLATESGQVQ